MRIRVRDLKKLVAESLEEGPLKRFGQKAALAAYMGTVGAAGAAHHQVTKHEATVQSPEQWRLAAYRAGTEAGQSEETYRKLWKDFDARLRASDIADSEAELYLQIFVQSAQKTFQAKHKPKHGLDDTHPDKQIQPSKRQYHPFQPEKDQFDT